MSELTKEQKSHLAQLSQRAMSRTAAIARGQGVSYIPPAECSDLQSALIMLALDGSAKAVKQWRHEQVKLAVGKDGLCCCTQIDYKAVEAHLLHLLGADGAALNAHLRHDSEPKRQAMHLLQRACEKWDLHVNYAEAICRRQFRCALADATRDQIMAILFTVNNRGKRKAAKETA